MHEEYRRQDCCVVQRPPAVVWWMLQAAPTCTGVEVKTVELQLQGVKAIAGGLNNVE